MLKIYSYLCFVYQYGKTVPLHVYKLSTCHDGLNFYSCFIGSGLLAFNVTFNNISAISWRSVLLVEEIGVPEENHRPVASH